jgi:hypothetical protein
MKLVAGFVLGLVATGALLACAPRPMSDRLATLKSDGLRLAEVYDRIAQNPRPIDIAFVGSSHTMNGIDDRGIEDNLAQQGVAADVANLGVMWMGRDLHLFLIRELLARKTPKLIVLELNEHEPPYGHPLLPYVAAASDMFCCHFWFDLDFPKMFLLFLKEQTRGVVSILWRPDVTAVSASKSWDFGWDPVDRVWDSRTPKTPSLGDRFERLLGERSKAFAYRLTAAFGDDTVAQIVELARSRHVQILFLYLPEYVYAAYESEDNVSFHEKLAPTIRLPGEVVADPLNWFDVAHLNRAGALKVVPELSAQIAAYLRGR